MSDEGGVAVRTVPLSQLVRRLPDALIKGEVRGVSVSGVTFDSRQVVPGSLHCCLTGGRFDGHEFADEARRAGAVAFLCERPLFGNGDGGTPEIRVQAGAARPAMAVLASAFEGDPWRALRTVGVTGTNGKTTVTHLVASILDSAGWPTAVIGTLGGLRTTPEAPHLQRALRSSLERGKLAVAMEVTSHALVQHRVDTILFDVAAFTNLSQDHLDFHGTMEAYFEAKARLFTPAFSTVGVVNGDDPYGRRLLEEASRRGLVRLRPFFLAEAEDLTVGATASRFRLRGHEVELSLGGPFNVANALAAAAIAEELGLSPQAVAAGLGRAVAVPGRFEPVENDHGLAVVVDYAHTPNGLEEVLRAARAGLSGKIHGRLITVFGCGGDRDHGKRPQMGRIATSEADVAVLTSDNPRSEDPMAIIEEVRGGAVDGALLLVEPDRESAIRIALGLATPDDVVVIAGKGHETYQELADRTIPFDDRETVRRILAELVTR